MQRDENDISRNKFSLKNCSMFTFTDVSPFKHAKPPISLLSSSPGLIRFEYPCRLTVDKSYRTLLMTTNERYSAEKYYNCLQNTQVIE